MPELPEVEITVRQLKKEVIGLKITDVWTDWKRAIKHPADFEEFRKKIRGAGIQDIQRRGKFLLFYLSGKRLLLAHQKLTGHFLLGKWEYQPNKKQKWQPLIKGPLEDRINDYLHLIFFLSDGRQLALSDLRKFAWVALYEDKKAEELPEIEELGPEPLANDFTPKVLEERLSRTKRPIKQVLMDARVIAGIGNIYSDEILFQAKIHPLTPAKSLSKKQIKTLYFSIRKILKQAIRHHGATILSGAEEFRQPSGQKGAYQNKLYVYRRTGQPCLRCKTPIQRIRVGQRSAHFCPRCQKEISS